MFVIATPTDRSRLTVTVSIKYMFLNFDIGGLTSDKFCDLSIISKWEKNERRLFCTKIIQNTLKHRATGRIDFLSRNIVTGVPCHVAKVISGHGRSPAVFRV